MSVWEQRTSQLRRHRQMSSREILFSSPSEEKDGPPTSAHGQHGRPLSLHRKALEHTPSGSMKLLKDPIASPVKNQAPDSSISLNIPLDSALSGEIPEPPESVLTPESLVPTKPLSDASLSVPEPVSEGRKLLVNQSHNATSEHHSPRLNGERQHRAVKKFRPPDNLDTLTPQMGGHDGIKGRRALYRCDRQSGGTSQGSAAGNESNMASRSVSRERKRNPGKVQEMEEEPKREDEASQPDESR